MIRNDYLSPECLTQLGFSTHPTLIAFISILVTLLVFFRKPSRPILISVDWTGQRDELSPRARAYFRRIFAGRRSLHNGYAQVDIFGPHLLSTGRLKSAGLPLPKVFYQKPPLHSPLHITILPASQIFWLISQPDSVLSARIPQGDRIAIDYLLPTLDFDHTTFQFDIKKADPNPWQDPRHHRRRSKEQRGRDYGYGCRTV